MESQPIRTVVFDAVGTLIYPNPAVADVYAAVASRFGSKLVEPEIARRFRAVFAEVEKRDRSGNLHTNEAIEIGRWREIVRRVLDDVSDYADCFTELWRHFAQPSSWKVFPDVPPALAELTSRGVRLAIASNFDQRLLRIAQQLEPLKICQPVLVSSQVGYRKPHPRFFEIVRTTLGVPACTVLYVGDDPDNDIAAARQVGFQTILLRRQGAVGVGEAASILDVLRLAGSLESNSRDA